MLLSGGRRPAYSYVSNFGSDTFTLVIDEWEGVGGYCRGSFEAEMIFGSERIRIENGRFEFEIK